MKLTDEWLYENLPKAENVIINKIPDQPDLSFCPSERYRRRMKRLLRQSRHPRLNYRYMKTGGRAAAILVLCMGITGISAVGIGAVEELRVKLISRTEYADHAIEYYDVTGEGKIKYLTYVPEGYEMIDQDEQDNSYWADYENCSGEFIAYTVWVISDSAGYLLDTEFVSTESVTIRNHEVQIGYKEDGMICCSWQEEGSMYFLDATGLEKEEAIKMIKGIR